MSASFEAARALCVALAGPTIDQWTLPREVAEYAATTGRPLRDAALDVVSGWLATHAQEQGDPAARDRLLALWHREVLRWCRWHASRGVEPEDLAHDVLVRAMERLHTLTRPRGFRPWLWSVAWRVLREHLRRPFKRRWQGDIEPDHRRSDGPRPDEGLLAEEQTAETRAVLEALPIEDRRLLWHAYAEGATRSQIAESLGWPLGTVHRRLTAARRRFRREAERRGLSPFTLPGRELA